MENTLNSITEILFKLKYNEQNEVLKQLAIKMRENMAKREEELEKELRFIKTQKEILSSQQVVK